MNLLDLRGLSMQLPPFDSGAGENETTSLAVECIHSETNYEHELLGIICQRIRTASRHLNLSRGDLDRIFGPYHLFEGEAIAMVNGKLESFLVVEAHHEMQGKIGKGALKIM